MTRPLQNGDTDHLAGGVILPSPAAKTWTCLNGHTLNADQPFRMVVPLPGGAQQLISGPFCPLCAIDFLEKSFPLAEVAAGTGGATGSVFGFHFPVGPPAG